MKAYFLMQQRKLLSTIFACHFLQVSDQNLTTQSVNMLFCYLDDSVQVGTLVNSETILFLQQCCSPNMAFIGRFGQTTPPLVDFLKDILRRYPEGGQILKVALSGTGMNFV
uniref:Uncharacterized protein n=1 Tax=Myripristis murdjan TaxID=586833 RepID=A0A667XQ20_9TELE